MRTVLAALSGGVDSAVTALLLQRAGFDVTGCTMQLSGEQAQELADAKAICQALGAAHHTLDCRAQFREAVMAEFVRQYEAGLTPNPCIACNRSLKFGRLLEFADALGLDAVATGHYARVEFDEASDRWLLKTALDETKDQTYVLYMLTQAQLARVVFPLGGYTKPQVRGIAEQAGFVNARKRDSQDICFIPDGDYGAFLERFSGKTYPAGDFLAPDGRILGRHRGAVRYTIGQRKGLGLALPAPGYVIAKDMAANTVTVGTNEALFSSRVQVTDCNWIAIAAEADVFRAEAKLRYSQRRAACTVRRQGNTALLEFDEPQRAVTPGQAAVCYTGDTVLGGGVIVKGES